MIRADFAPMRRLFYLLSLAASLLPISAQEITPAIYHPTAKTVGVATIDVQYRRARRRHRRRVRRYVRRHSELILNGGPISA